MRRQRPRGRGACAHPNETVHVNLAAVAQVDVAQLLLQVLLLLVMSTYPWVLLKSGLLVNNKLVGQLQRQSQQVVVRALNRRLHHQKIHVQWSLHLVIGMMMPGHRHSTFGDLQWIGAGNNPMWAVMAVSFEICGDLLHGKFNQIGI